MDGGESEGVRWALVGDIRRSDAGSGRHSDDGRVPLKVAFARFRRVVVHSETGPKWVLGELSPVMSGYIRLAGNGLSNIPSNTPLVASAYPTHLDGTGAPVAPPLASSLHPSFHLPLVPPGAVLRAPGALPKPGRMSMLPGSQRAAPRRGEAILTMVAT